MLNCYTDGLDKLCGACALVLDLRGKHVNIHLNCGYFDLIQLYRAFRRLLSSQYVF